MVVAMIADKLSRLRGGRNYSEVARGVGYSTNAIRDVEAGRTDNPRIDLVRKLSEFYGVSLEWLADDSQDWPPPPTEKQQLTETLERVLAGAGLAGELNDDERELISGFRGLNGEARGRVLGMIEGLNASNASPPDLNPDLAEEPPPGRT